MMDAPIPVNTDGCHGGRLGFGQLSMDSIDYYRVFIPAGQTLTYSLGAGEGAPIELVITDGAGNPIDEPIGPDGIATYTSATDQNVYIQTSTTKLDATQFSYLVGLEVGPPERPCNPNC